MFINGKELDNEKGHTRAGVIPFTVYERRIYFLLGIDRRTRELTDFGGGIKSSETIADAAFREFNEETIKIFKSVNKDHIKQSPAVTNSAKNTAIFFLRVNPEWLNLAETEFIRCQKQYKDVKKYNELIGVKWVIDTDFKLVAFDRKNQCMWKRIQNILRWNTNWHELRVMLLLGPELTNVVNKSWVQESDYRSITVT
jgi:hypothetical protein